MKKVVVTGATSMIGAALLETLLTDCNLQKIYAVVRVNSNKLKRIPTDPRVEIVQCDINDYQNLPDMILERCDVFYHLAWSRTLTYEESYDDICLKVENVQATMKAVKAAAQIGCKKFIGTGSQSEYGILTADKISPDSLCNPVRADGILHLAAGKLARMLSNNLGMSCIWMRVFSVYGKYDRNNSLISTTVRKLSLGQKCSFTAATQNWDYLAAGDAGRAFYLVGEKDLGDQVYCVGSGETKQLRWYIETIRDVISPGTKLTFGELPYPKDAVMHLCADVTKLKKDAGWMPTIDFRDGIQEIYDYFQRSSCES